MYGYRTKHKILIEYLKELKKDSPKGGDLDIKHTVNLKVFCNNLGKNEKQRGYIAQQMSNLTMDGYLSMQQSVGKEDMDVTITPMGVNAVLSELYKIKQHEWFWKAFMNTVMTVANVAVAVTAVWALTKDNDELQKIEERVSKLEKAQKSIQVKANPSIAPTIQSDQTNPINNVKKTSTPDSLTK